MPTKSKSAAFEKLISIEEYFRLEEKLLGDLYPDEADFQEDL